VPSPFSREALLVLLQGGLLVSRTLLTEHIARVEGFCGRSIISLQFDKFGQALLAFAALGVPAAVVNSGLKFMQKQIELSFQSRLTCSLHAQYCQVLLFFCVCGGVCGGVCACCVCVVFCVCVARCVLRVSYVCVCVL
jgi:hypothetical protein